VIPPPAPASAPQTNCPVAEFHKSLSAEPEHEVRPAPKMYPLFKFRPFMTLNPPAIVEVDVVDEA